MPIEPKRIEAAARARFERIGSGHLWLSLTEEARQSHIRQVAEVAADLYPELASDPPTAWVAPIMTANDMRPLGAEFEKVWDDNADILHEGSVVAARDAHTEEQT